jgi:hypothetical protein
MKVAGVVLVVCKTILVIPMSDGRQPAPSEHAPRKYAAIDPDSGTYTVAEEENPEAWVRASTEDSVPVIE